MAESRARPNRLINETSAYLRQHAYNPVDWYPWSSEAFERAAREGKPIFLSIGYSACHWCHVMEKESFEDPEIAELLNREFVCIKVDREERPDVDQLYMTACQAMTGHGGWPLSVFLTPEGKPFFAGTYFPPTRRHGLPSFREVLEQIARSWKSHRREIEERAENIWWSLEQALSTGRLGEGQASDLGAWELLDDAVDRLKRLFDERYGGFGGAPKFPRAPFFVACLWAWAREKDVDALRMATVSLNAMAYGGIHDQIGGGFHRYATDARWIVPHFEKMLYDNALLLGVYTEAYLATSNEEYRRVAERTAEYLLREMRVGAGPFAASQDADSEGEEGKYYVWTWSELSKLLSPDELRVAEAIYGFSPYGNWEGKNIPVRHLPLDQAAVALGLSVEDVCDAMDRIRHKLLRRRDTRVPPARDDKIIASWNGLTIEALALAGATLGNRRYTEAAAEAAQFVWDVLTDEVGTGGKLGLYHSWCRGRRSVPGYLDDYAAVAHGFLTLYEVGGGDVWLRRALLLCAAARERFERAPGVWSLVSEEHDLPLRDLADVHDSATPSAVALWLRLLARLSWMLPEQDLGEAFEMTWSKVRATVEAEPLACLSSILAACFYEAPPGQVSISRSNGGPFMVAGVARLVWREIYLPWKVVRWQGFEEKKYGPPVDPERFVQSAEVLVCRGTTCMPRPTTVDDLREQLLACVAPPTQSPPGEQS